MSIFKCVESNADKYITYGISVDGKIAVEDISSNKQFVENLVLTFNEQQLDPIHLFEILDDIL